ncbi:MAG: putative quinol monooxygenase [Rhizobiaceae bacterium]
MTAVGIIPVHADDRQGTTAITHGFHATMKAKPGQGDAVVALLFEAPVFDDPDCKVFLIGRSKSDPDVVFVTEGWVSEAAHAEFGATAASQAYAARFAPLVDEWTTSDEIPVGGKAVLD